MKRPVRCFVMLIILLGSFLSPAAAQDTVVRAILFYSPTCPHCHKVINEDLPPLLDNYNSQLDWTYLSTNGTPDPDELPPIIGAFGDHLQILYINGASAIGSELYHAAIDLYSIPEDRRVVPALIIGESVLFGSIEIPERFPILIEQGLSQGGIDWPDLPGLAELISLLVPIPTEEASPIDTPSPEVETTTLPTSDTQPSPTTPKPTELIPTFDLDQSKPSVINNIKQDLVGNIVAIIVLIGMVLVFALTLLKVLRQYEGRTSQPISIYIPLLSLLGIFVAGYLTFVETGGTEVFCGPIGDCNTVQQSKYAMLFGIIPVGVLGLAGYAAILGAWFIAQRTSGRPSILATIALFSMTTFGALFSIYLTFLEPFVIGATCTWCLISAILITAQFWLSADPMIDALERL